MKRKLFERQDRRINFLIPKVFSNCSFNMPIHDEVKFLHDLEIRYSKIKEENKLERLRSSFKKGDFDNLSVHYLGEEVFHAGKWFRIMTLLEGTEDTFICREVKTHYLDGEEITIPIRCKIRKRTNSGIDYFHPRGMSRKEIMKKQAEQEELYGCKLDFCCVP